MRFKKALRWITIICLPLFVVINLFGALFRIQHWEGGGLLITIGSFGTLIAMVSAFLYAAMVKPHHAALPTFDFEETSEKRHRRPA